MCMNVVKHTYTMEKDHPLDVMPVTRSGRLRQQKVIFTPSKQVQQAEKKVMNYDINKKKAIKKKISATHREYSVEFDPKPGTLVITCSAAAYEILRKEISRWFTSHPTRYIKLFSKESKGRQTPTATVEDSFSVRDNNTKEQLYRMNLFHTTCWMDVNGRHYTEFIKKELPNIIQVLDMIPNIHQLDQKLREMCENYLQQIDNMPEWPCDVCGDNCEHRAAQCDMCYSWTHYKCNNLSQRVINQLENSASTYKCKTCTKGQYVSANKTSIQIRSKGTTGKNEVPKSLCSLSLPSVDQGKGNRPKHVLNF